MRKHPQPSPPDDNRWAKMAWQHAMEAETLISEGAAGSVSATHASLATFYQLRANQEGQTEAMEQLSGALRRQGNQMEEFGPGSR
ncbi:hypothetical protein ACIGG9_15950 [Pseudonocardia alni]|uniref:hypothetical protein n=1 Tax=Pseudonocardia alni TaxID=33907 RepID=UPI0033D2848A